MSQKIADWLGFGRIVTTAQRQKLATGLTDAVSDISQEIGIPMLQTPSETGNKVADFLYGISEKGPYYESFNKLIKGIPETRWPNTLDAIDALGKRLGYGGEEMTVRNLQSMMDSMGKGLKNIGSIYGKKSGLVNELTSLGKPARTPGFR